MKKGGPDNRLDWLTSRLLLRDAVDIPTAKQDLTRLRGCGFASIPDRQLSRELVVGWQQ